ncbi:uncharacterized protein LOC134543042 isoform X2 [Bacillus rossius redtenbacheri]|uniref:uncharacterized protein LOC134543042 isoform X2 n=1 Tax=Bacillus rossius redtenbacheri TaxID=93214 RepID=UPI002FDE7248
MNQVSLLLPSSLILWLFLVENCLSASHSSSFCGEKNTSCNDQLRNQLSLKNNCQTKYIPQNSKECKDWLFEGTASSQLRTVRLEAYVNTEYGYTLPAFNVSFRPVKWKRIRFRFQSDGRNLCRQFNLEVADSRPIYFDCRWVTSHDKNGSFVFEYDVSDDDGLRERGKFLLLVPLYSKEASEAGVSEWRPLVYVDVTELPRAAVRWDTLPRQLRGWSPDGLGYEVTLHHWAGGRETERKLASVSAGGELLAVHEVGPAPGTYRFGVRASHPACGPAGCPVSFSPPVVVEGHTRFFTVVKVTCFGLILLVLVALFLLRSWLVRSQADSKLAPAVLVVYVPTHGAHVRVVKELATYLRSRCGVRVLLHDTDVPRENVQEWFSDAFARADFVMVVASPLQHTDLRETIYKDAGEIGLKLLRLTFASPGTPPGGYFCVTLPYSGAADLPRDAVHFRRFHLARELDHMLRHLRGGGRCLPGKLLSLLRVRVPGGSAHYRVSGGQLETAIARAAREIPGYLRARDAVGECPGQTSPSPLVLEETASFLGTLESDVAEVQGPDFPVNIKSALSIENGLPGSRPAQKTRRVIGPSMKL